MEFAIREKVLFRSEHFYIRQAIELNTAGYCTTLILLSTLKCDLQADNRKHLRLYLHNVNSVFKIVNSFDYILRIVLT